jgi:hypothetical protein
MILCGERVDAETAQRIGLVEEVVDSGERVDGGAGPGGEGRESRVRPPWLPARA